MKNSALLLCFIFIYGLNLYSQDISSKPPENRTWFLHLESGYIYPEGSIRESIAIRQNISSYYVNQDTDGHISSETYGFTLGLRWEYFNPRFKTGISTGLRYTGYRSEISGYSSSISDFFYMRYSMQDGETRFARVRSIDETNNFLSIPLELRLVPLQYKRAGFFVKAGAEISFLNFEKGTDIDFQEGGMEAHQDIVLNSIGMTTNKVYSTVYGSVGLKLGQENKPNYSFEVFIPSLFLTGDNFTLTDVDHFTGFRISIQFPLKKQN